MFSSILASMSLVATLQTTTNTEFSQRTPTKPRQNPAVATSHATIGVVDRAIDTPKPETPPAPGPLDRARAAMESGEFDLARREFRAAADSARKAGALPVEELRGLTVALYARGYTIEAAWTMEDLAREALLRGDRETQALALADAIWLYVDGGQRPAAARVHTQLCAVVTETPLSSETLKVIHDRVRGVRKQTKGVNPPAPANR